MLKPKNTIVLGMSNAQFAKFSMEYADARVAHAYQGKAHRAVGACLAPKGNQHEAANTGIREFEPFSKILDEIIECAGKPGDILIELSPDEWVTLLDAFAVAKKTFQHGGALHQYIGKAAAGEVDRSDGPNAVVRAWDAIDPQLKKIFVK